MPPLYAGHQRGWTFINVKYPIREGPLDWAFGEGAAGQVARMRIAFALAFVPSEERPCMAT